MNWHRTMYLAVLAGALTAVLLPALSYATPSGGSGEIAFARFRFVNSPLRREIWVARPDGSGLRRLTRVGANYIDSDPSWAPDGSKLLFSRCAPLRSAPCDGRQTIWSVGSDGSRPLMLSPACRRKGTSRASFRHCPDDGQGVYSPNGELIAFFRYAGVPEIGIADSHLRHVRLLHPLGSGSGVPDIDALAWSADGRRLAFSVHNNNGKLHKPVGGRAVYVINVKGGGLRRVTPWKLEAGGTGELDWSPDGSRLLFRSVTDSNDEPGPPSGDIYTIRPDGTGLQRLTHFPAGTSIQLGSYSPDGAHIVFTSNDGSTPGPASAWPDVFVMRADGTGITPVTRTKNWEGTPQWGAS